MTALRPKGPLLLGDGWQGDRPGGLNRYFADLFAALTALGVNPRAVVLGPGCDVPTGVTPVGKPSRPLPSRLWLFQQATRQLRSRTDVVDAHFALNALWPVVFGAARRIPLVVHFQGPWAEESVVQGDTSTSRTVLRRRIERTVYRRATRVIVLSTAFKRILVERYGLPPWRIVAIPPGVDHGRFCPGDRARARGDLGVPQTVDLVVTVRRLVPRMGLDVLLDAWALVLRSHRDAILVVVGEGSERGILEARAESLGVTGSVRFMGRIDEATLVDCYRAADLSVVPSLALEGFGLSVLESLSCGTPVIATAIGGLPEALAPLDPSLLVAPGDAGALAARIGAALDGEPSLPDASQCRQYAESFDWRHVALRHRTVYAEAVDPPPARIRVVYVDHCAQLSGGELALLRLLPSLSGVDAHVVLGQDGPLVAKLLQAGISVEVMAMAEKARGVPRDRVVLGRLPVTSALRSATYAIRLACHLRRLRPDLVHTNSLKAALYGGLAGRLAGVPVVWHVRDRIADDYLPCAAVRLVRSLAHRVPAAIIANSKATLATLGETGVRQTVVPSPVIVDSRWGAISRRVVHDAVRIDSGDGLARPPAQGHTADGLRVGIIGRLAPWKGQHVFLDAFDRAFPGDDGSEAVVVGSALFGESAYEEALHEQVRGLDIQDRVIFRGFRDDICAELARLDIVVHASVIPEPFGQVIVEAMAMGLPVVAAAAGGPLEIVEHEETGLLYPPGDVESLALALKRLAGDPDLRHRLGAAAQERAGDFAPQVVAPLVMAVYRDVLERHRPNAR